VTVVFTVTFRTANAAFTEDGDPSAETARLLHDIAERVETGHRSGPVVDVNGNTVGTWTLTEDDTEHAAYPHEPGTLYGCPACEARCHCTEDAVTCIYDGEHNGLGADV
jgi:hypothetical protein